MEDREVLAYKRIRFHHGLNMNDAHNVQYPLVRVRNIFQFFYWYAKAIQDNKLIRDVAIKSEDTDFNNTHLQFLYAGIYEPRPEEESMFNVDITINTGRIATYGWVEELRRELNKQYLILTSEYKAELCDGIVFSVPIRPLADENDIPSEWRDRITR
jgi:hypothetical protein